MYSVNLKCVILAYVNFFKFFFSEIITILKEGTVILRPALDGVASDDELLEMMDKCWMEDPADRPDFGQIKATLRRLNKLAHIQFLVLSLIVTFTLSFIKIFSQCKFSSEVHGTREPK